MAESGPKNVVLEKKDKFLFDDLKEVQDIVLKCNSLSRIQWTPSGNQLVTLTDDEIISVFNLSHEENPINLVLSKQFSVGKSASDFSLSPKFDSEPYVLATKSTFGYSALTWDLKGKMVNSYGPHDGKSSHILSIDAKQMKLYSCIDKEVKVFKVDDPNKEFDSRKPSYYTKVGDKVEKICQNEIISCIASNPSNISMYACGFDNGKIGIYYEPQGVSYCVWKGHENRVDQLRFSKDGECLYSNATNEIFCWYVRNGGVCAFKLNTVELIDQKMYFDFEPSWSVLMSISHGGMVEMWNLPKKEELKGIERIVDKKVASFHSFQAHSNVVNAISHHPTLPIIATGGKDNQMYLKLWKY